MMSLSVRLRGDEQLIGLLVKMPGPAIIELAGFAGFDFVVIDTEHGDAGSLEHHLRAAEAADIPALVRVGEGTDIEILRALDAGAVGVIVPHVTSAAQAAAVVSAGHYPPHGHRGLSGTTRAGRHGLIPLSQVIAAAKNETIVLAQIEDREAIDKAGAIAGTDGLNGIFLGRTDLSASLGHPAEAEHPEVLAAFDEIVSEVARTDSTLAVLVGTATEARGWFEHGARMVVFAAPSIFARALSGLVLETRG